jgi:hypothetical protein
LSIIGQAKMPTVASDLVLSVKNKILTPPHKLRAKFDSLFELLFGLAL